GSVPTWRAARSTSPSPRRSSSSVSPPRSGKALATRTDDEHTRTGPRLVAVPGAARAPARPAPHAHARGLAPPDRLLGLVRQGYPLAPARRRPAQAVRPAGRLRPARRPHRLRVPGGPGRLPAPPECRLDGGRPPSQPPHPDPAAGGQRRGGGRAVRVGRPL